MGIRNAADDSETKARLQAAEEERKATIAKLSAKAEPTMLPGSATFSLEELKECKERTEAMDIDLAKKELYLSDSDFTEVFGMSKDEFSALAKQARRQEEAGRPLLSACGGFSRACDTARAPFPVFLPRCSARAACSAVAGVVRARL